MVTKAIPPPLMSHEERRKLIEAPINTRIIGGRAWGGATRTRPYVQGTYIDPVLHPEYDILAGLLFGEDY